MPDRPAQPAVTCPRCQTRQPRRGPDSLYRCAKCGGMFDDEPDEGGDWSDYNPAARLERAERRPRQPQPRRHGP